MDELILIFKYCSSVDHGNIGKVCKLFEVIMEKYFNEMKCRNLLMVSHVKSFENIFDRTLNSAMKFSERLRLHQNWTFGCCQQIQFFQHRENYKSHIQMDHDSLYAASLGEFNIYKRRLKDGIQIEPIFTSGHKNDSIITSLKRNDEMIAGARSNGSVFTYTDWEGYNMDFVRDYFDKILDLDFCRDIFVTTSKAGTKFHRLTMELDLLAFDATNVSLDRGLESINFNPIGDKILGTQGNKFLFLDPGTGLVSAEHSIKPPQIFNSLWIDNDSFLYTSCNNSLSLIDTRCSYRQQEFSCGNLTASCIDYDGRFGIIYGTLLGMMLLCDLRKPKTFERIFHLETATVCRSIKSDATHLFVSTDNAIYLLNFD